MEYTCEINYGTIELVTDYKFEDNKFWVGGHSIHRDKEGNIVKMTEPEYYCYMTFEGEKL